jgi:RNA polymerase sigma-70 factor, ECF subfamily
MASRANAVVSEQTQFDGSTDPMPQAEPEELSAIYVTHYQEVLRVCGRFMRQREDAEDAAAEVFLKLHWVLEKRDPAMPFRPWLSQVARRHCIDKLRQKKAQRRLCLDGIDVGEVADGLAISPLAQILRAEKQRQLREQLNRLPDHLKVPLVLRYYKQMSYREIAGALNRQLPAVRLMIFRAKSKLRNNLRLLSGPQVASLFQPMD